MELEAESYVNPMRRGAGADELPRPATQQYDSRGKPAPARRTNEGRTKGRLAFPARLGSCSVSCTSERGRQAETGQMNAGRGRRKRLKDSE